MDQAKQIDEELADDVGNTVKNDSNRHKNQRLYGDKKMFNKNPCWFYLNDHCKYGSSCKFEHPKSASSRFRFENQRHWRSNSYNSAYKSPRWRSDAARNDFDPAVGFQSQEYHVNSRHPPANNVKPRYRNYRVFTNSNRFASKAVGHSDENIPQEQNSSTKEAEVNKPINIASNLNTRLPLQLSLLNENDLQFLRQTEIAQLNKRYPNLKTDLVDGDEIFVFSFSSSDPDWYFDLKSVELNVCLPIRYPKEICEITVLNTDEYIPELLQKFLNRSLREWIEERHKSLASFGKTEIVLRPFFRWLDKNLEQLFIHGLRKVKRDVEARNLGLEFVPFEALPGANLSSDDQVDERKNLEEGVHLLAENFEELKCDETPPDLVDLETLDVLENLTSTTRTPDSTRAISKRNDNSKKGTEVKLLNFELKDGAASLQCHKIAVNVRCTRCKSYSDINSLSKQKPFTGSCSKCHQVHSAVFHPVLMHAFSGILGYLHLNGCQAVDLPLVQCDFVLDCLNCNKQNNVNGINYGQNFSTWCLFCNQKLCISAQAAKFHQLLPVERNTKLEPSVSEVNKRRVRDPLIEVGKPLPNDGNCKHYKKSYRWLRFPCCGKAYPCDLCHDEKETDHEMKFASRMICGFCSKEQPYSKEKACDSCSTLLTKKAGSHWEGGKGCRDKIRMSRDDKHKYAGSGKTISRKAVTITPKKKNQK